MSVEHYHHVQTPEGENLRLNAKVNRLQNLLKLSVEENTRLRDENLILTYENIRSSAENQVHRESLNEAAELQEESLPTEGPKIQGFDFGLRSFPAINGVSGDFHDFIEITSKNNGVFTPEKLVVIVADAVGKNIGAAMLAMSTHSSFHLVANLGDPEKILLPINFALMNATKDHSKFVTAICSQLDIKSGHIRWARAGHPYPIFIKPNGMPIPLKFRDSEPLNLTINPMLDTRDFTLTKGSGVFFYTDGITEAINEKIEMFGETRLQNIITANWDKSVQEICDTVIQTVKNWQRGQNYPSDDVTIFGLRRNI
jgi:serine phosphatase RsbU (regulator of sigma subunit)